LGRESAAGRLPADRLSTSGRITVHLTFAQRAYELAHVSSLRRLRVMVVACAVVPDEVALHADILAIGGVQLCAILNDIAAGTPRRLSSRFSSTYRQDPASNTDALAQEELSHHDQPHRHTGCHNRCGFCYLQRRDCRSVSNA